MATPANKNKIFKENVPGKYSVNTECIGCALCGEIAPDNFKANYEGDDKVVYSYMFKQPENEQEEELCGEAMLNCPVDAIAGE